MPIRFRRSIKALDDGTLQVRMGAAERALLSAVAAELAEELDHPDDDPDLQRLFPPGYADDAARDAGYQMMMGDELRRGHVAALRELAATADAERLEPARAQAWLRSINAVRLVVGTRLGIDEDTPLGRIRRGDPDLRARVAYDVLTVLLDDLIAALGD